MFLAGVIVGAWIIGVPIGFVLASFFIAAKRADEQSAVAISRGERHLQIVRPIADADDL